MSSMSSSREVVRQSIDTFNKPQNRESSYFDLYDDSSTMHGLSPNLPSNRDGFKQFIHLRMLTVFVVFILFFFSGATILDVNNYASASPTSSDGRSTANPLPFLPPFPVIGKEIQGDQRINLVSDTGSLTIKKVKVGASEQTWKRDTYVHPESLHTKELINCCR